MYYNNTTAQPLFETPPRDCTLHSDFAMIKNKTKLVSPSTNTGNTHYDVIQLIVYRIVSPFETCVSSATGAGVVGGWRRRVPARGA
jgi:hypothetical protein